jgi:hypothetical protein
MGPFLFVMKLKFYMQRMKNTLSHKKITRICGIKQFSQLTQGWEMAKFSAVTKQVISDNSV